MKRTLVVALLLAPSLAAAGNGNVCAERATEIARDEEVVVYCEACGDKAPGIPFIATDVIVDPVHTYVRAGPRFENLALVVGCPAPGVHPTLDITDETAAGVLITPSDKPIVRDVDIVVPDESRSFAPAPPAQPAAAPSYAYTYATTIQYNVPWSAIALVAGGAGFLLGSLTTLMVIVLRRRRAMEPRATHLRS